MVAYDERSSANEIPAGAGRARYFSYRSTNVLNGDNVLSKPVRYARVPDPISNYTNEIAQRQFLRPADVIQQFLRIGAFEHQMREGKPQEQS
jgi:hypothetical protein